MNQSERRVRIRPVRRDQPDLRRLAKALIELATVETATSKKPKRKGAA